ncbi:lipid A export ATP-binding/permease protein MsbA [Sulfuriferula plumbiphila]|uniref:Lipid A export ATP-binding/permease protein MsbA n=1 Tax=Sulfuriferula plumbiphila TaxID=171865 RepID=A0A512L4G8_9PROT|nr:lipid A export permease/ATP-binding protein MsbA [Sulfuriferula plumbiphila]BBP02797.1 lipid A export ATP-binding/permease protein MsbA [Sulfuriferula plumbiphila]GEP29091.1 lipid A export ATP-binding/permease protein MsbA [Sulfuriferula plumbiphila]
MTSPPKTGLSLYLRLLRHVRLYWKMFAGALLAMAVTAAAEPAIPALFKPLLDGSFVQKDPDMIRLIPLVMIALFVVRGLADFAATYGMNWVGSRLVMDLRTAMFRKLVAMPTRFYDDSSTGTLIAHIVFNVTQVTQSATSAVTLLVRDTLAIAGLLGWLLWLNWKLTLIIIAIAPLAIFIIRTVSGRLRNINRQAQQNLGEITHVVEESVGAHKVVKIFGGQDYELQRFGTAVNNARRYFMKGISAAAANGPVVQLVAALGVALVVYIATQQAQRGELTVGGFVSYMIAMLMIFGPVKRLTGVNEQLQRGLAAAEVVFELIDRDTETDTGSQVIGRARGALEFRHVTLAYPDKPTPALNDINLAIRPGETVALVGASGSGKTSLVNLIPRFYTPDSGQILLDGQVITDITLASLRANIALVSQDVVLFNDSIAANIAYGAQAGATAAHIIRAAEAAHAMEFICEQPHGLQTMVGENGVKLSGGQRQRIAIARALLKDAPVLILDEATSALDTQSERHVQAALEALMQGRTTLVIAHRLSTIENADRIAVMQQGRIIEIGSHRELLDKNGAYAHLHRLQFHEPK